MFDGARSVVQVITVRQQVQNRALPLKSDVMALFGLMTGKRIRCDDVKKGRGLQ